MSTELRAGALLHFKTLLAAVIEAAARTYGAAPFAVCCVNLGDVDGRRFALALHEASPTELDPAPFRGDGGHGSALWCRAAPAAVFVRVAAEVLGADMSADADEAHATSAVPVVIVGEGLAIVTAFDRPPGDA